MIKGKSVGLGGAGGENRAVTQESWILFDWWIKKKKDESKILAFFLLFELTKDGGSEFSSK